MKQCWDWKVVQSTLITKARVLVSNSYDPYFNLGLEEYLLENVGEEEIILYLWRNENTVVIGRNQNPWNECNLEYLAKVKGKIARRLSGGGAVYHDLGNVNFTFLTHENNENLKVQLEVIVKALYNVGIQAEFSGRNDILVDGKKISGNAFYWDNSKYYHHGTLLYDVDIERLTKILTPSMDKLTSKGIESVRSRVKNLKECQIGLTIEDIIKEIIKTFQNIYMDIDEVEVIDEKSINIQRHVDKYSSVKWVYGESPEFNVTMCNNFSYGKVEINLLVKDSIIRTTKIYTDSLFVREFIAIEEIITGCYFDKKHIKEALVDNKALFSKDNFMILKDIIEMIDENILNTNVN